jgi:hypothetical protein
MSSCTKAKSFLKETWTAIQAPQIANRPTDLCLAHHDQERKKMKHELVQWMMSPLKRTAILGCFAVTGLLPIAASAQVSINIDIGVPPPPPRVEEVPAVPVGYVWAPGYWEWFHGHHVWRRGHLVAGRPGYVWVADRWEPHGQTHHFVPGHWESDPGYYAQYREHEEHARDDHYEHKHSEHARHHDDH